jgi:hypothetical protein
MSRARALLRISSLIIGSICSLLAVATAAIHIATFFSQSLKLNDLIFFHFLVMAGAIATIVIYQVVGESMEPAALPAWSKRPLQVGFCYFVLTFILFLIHVRGGSPEIVNGVYQLTNHGKLIQNLSAAEYERAINHELRFFSAGWALMFSVAFAYLWHLWRVLHPGFREIQVH